jgi:hypothetical protein
MIYSASLEKAGGAGPQKASGKIAQGPLHWPLPGRRQPVCVGDEVEGSLPQGRANRMTCQVDSLAAGKIESSAEALRVCHTRHFSSQKSNPTTPPGDRSDKMGLHGSPFANIIPIGR